MRLGAYLKGTNDEILDFLITAATADTAVTDEQKRVLKADNILLKHYIEKKLGIELFLIDLIMNLIIEPIVKNQLRVQWNLLIAPTAERSVLMLTISVRVAAQN